MLKFVRIGAGIINLDRVTEICDDGAIVRVYFGSEHSMYRDVEADLLRSFIEQQQTMEEYMRPKNLMDQI